MNNIQDKESLRKEMRAKRRVMDQEQCKRAATEILPILMPLLKNIKALAIYHADNTELNLSSIIEYCLNNHIEVYQPIALKSGKTMRFERLEINIPAGIFYQEDYKLSHELKWYNLDLVLLPLLAADSSGFRLGQGGGYYDTTFSGRDSKPLLCGVGYDWQLIENVPHEDWDIKLDYFASDKKLYKF